ncbi:MAG: hypothetical protein CMJ18_03105 [Phycisphaeraceae bacterium]|nr:hypothetical protein [Phycisphaeraceae bacterium]
MGKAYRAIGGLSIHEDYVDLLAAEGLDAFDALMSARGEADLDKPGLDRWRQRLQLAVGGRRLYLKRFDRPPASTRMSLRFHGFKSPAACEWHWLERVRDLGVAAPTPVACGGDKAEDRSLLLIDEVPGTSLEKWLPARGPAADRATRRRISNAVADLAARLHEAGLFHRDFYTAHLFVDESDERGIGLSLIDLQRMIEPRIRSRRWRIKDLSALNYSVCPDQATSTDRVRWFRRYRSIDRLTASDKRTIRDVVAKTRRVERHDVKKRGGEESREEPREEPRMDTDGHG